MSLTLKDDHLRDISLLTERESGGGQGGKQRERERERSTFGAHSKEVVLVFWG